MPAAVEIKNNVAAFYSLREPAWHGLGLVSDTEHDAYKVLELAQLANWDIHAVDLVDLLPKNLATHMEKKLTVRRNPFYDATDPESKEFDALGVVGGNYSIVQNEVLADFTQQVGGRVETAGSIKDGTTVFMSSALERDIVIDEKGANDVIKNYFMLYTSHDGTARLTGGVTPVRVVCANTLQVAKRGMKPTIAVRHNASAQERIEDAKKALDLQVQYTERFAELASDLFVTSVTDAKFFEMIKAAYPEPEKGAKKAQITRWQNKVDSLDTLWRGETQANIAGTAWAAFNALTEDQQWGRKVYSGNQENKDYSGSSMDEAANKERNRLLSVVETLAFA